MVYDFWVYVYDFWVLVLWVFVYDLWLKRLIYDLRVMCVWVYDFMEFLASTRNNVCLAICCVATSLDWCPQNTTKQQKTNKKTSLGQKSFSWLHEENRTKTCTYVHMYIWNESPCICGSVVQSEMNQFVTRMNELLSYEWIVISLLHVWMNCYQRMNALLSTYECIVIRVWMHCYQQMNALLSCMHSYQRMNALLSKYEWIVIIVWMHGYQSMNALLSVYEWMGIPKKHKKEECL